MFAWLFNDRLVLSTACLLVLLGSVSWFNIYNQEDPTFPYRSAHINFSYPGATAAEVEDNAIKVIERQLSGLEDLVQIDSSSLPGQGVISLELAGHIYETDLAWQRIRNEIAKLTDVLPSGVSQLTLNDRIGDTQGIVLSIQAKESHSVLEQRAAALSIKEMLLQVSGIRNVELVADPGRRVNLTYTAQQQLSSGISPLGIALLVSEQNVYRPVDSLRSLEYLNPVQSPGGLTDSAQINSLAINNKQGQNFILAQLLSVQEQPDEFADIGFRFNGKSSIGLAITLAPDSLRVTDFISRFDHALLKINQAYPELVIEKVFFQPRWTNERLTGLSWSLLFSFVLLALVLFILMDWRLALMVSVAIPVSTATTILIYGGLFNGVLEQMSMAGLVISLGLVVDNSIVSAELMQRYRQQGMSALAASKRTISELTKPLLCASLTTIAAFLPMLLATGDVADFVRTIPVVVITGIASSLFVALILVPALGRHLLKVKSSHTGSELGIRFIEKIISAPKTSLLFCFIILAGLSGSQAWVGNEFFPTTSRTTAYIDIELPAGSSYQSTLTQVKMTEKLLRGNESITDIASFIGYSGPGFYYNLNTLPRQKHMARIAFHTKHGANTRDVVRSLNTALDGWQSNAYIRAKELGQGPPIDSPIEIFINGNDRKQLAQASEKIRELLIAHDQTINSRILYNERVTAMKYRFDRIEMNKAGISNQDIGSYLQWLSEGYLATVINDNGYAVPVYIKASEKDTTHSSNLTSITLVNERGQWPISLFAQPYFSSESPQLFRRNMQASMAVRADLLVGANDDSVLESLAINLKTISDDFNVEISFGGEGEESSDANSAIMKALPVGLLLLVTCLLAQFGSIRLTFIILLSIPMAVLGIYPGLALSGKAFGFMALLGVLGLVGVVVNNGIVLIDKFLSEINQGQKLEAALINSVILRIRPILLSTLTTVLGLLPLAYSSSPLWPPLAWAMMSGMIFSTLLTLIVVPCATKLVWSKKQTKAAQSDKVTLAVERY
ncbi:efflux RND transporter permease subunit [Pseudoalteromonas neustonica]|uniref:efflux RND transporter permease subunit n=1 Tax=Pseudoalteromonas neustonica TaxID=1840331 RepID=UPI0007DB646E|nr:efflux RND transporter permease subunit [Pseudoalteromonas neustonica]